MKSNTNNGRTNLKTKVLFFLMKKNTNINIAVDIAERVPLTAKPTLARSSLDIYKKNLLSKTK